MTWLDTSCGVAFKLHLQGWCAMCGACCGCQPAPLLAASQRGRVQGGSQCKVCLLCLSALPDCASAWEGVTLPHWHGWAVCRLVGPGLGGSKVRRHVAALTNVSCPGAPAVERRPLASAGGGLRGAMAAACHSWHCCSCTAPKTPGGARTSGPELAGAVTNGK